LRKKEVSVFYKSSAAIDNYFKMCSLQGLPQSPLRCDFGMTGHQGSLREKAASRIGILEISEALHAARRFAYDSQTLCHPECSDREMRDLQG
jgi:hypothetical protein